MIIICFIANGIIHHFKNVYNSPWVGCEIYHSMTHEYGSDTIYHCGCGLHCIDKNRAIAQYYDGTEAVVEFKEMCLGGGGWHIESGIVQSVAA